MKRKKQTEEEKIKEIEENENQIKKITKIKQQCENQINKINQQCENRITMIKEVCKNQINTLIDKCNQDINQLLFIQQIKEISNNNINDIQQIILEYSELNIQIYMCLCNPKLKIKDLYNISRKYLYQFNDDLLKHPIFKYVEKLDA